MQNTDLDSTLRAHWGLAADRIEPLTGGMNSHTWDVSSGATRSVVKLVPRSRGRSFRAGLDTAALVQDGGIATGAPRPARNGRPAVLVQDGWLAVLEWVDGQPLGSSAADQAIIGATLGAVHTILATAPATSAPRFDWLEPDAPHLGVADWVRPAVRSALSWLDSASHRLTAQGLLHGDPAPESFRWAPGTETCALIDWSSSVWGPLLYDLASAVMYVGGITRGRPLVAAYRANGVIRAAEIDACLAPMLRVRWAVQADHFARRVATNDRTGVTGPEENLRGLLDARVHLIGR